MGGCISGLVICIGAALICTGTVNVGLAATQWTDTSPEEPSWTATLPILEELCARLAAFGLVEPMGMEPRTAARRECRPVLLRFGALNTPEPTSIFTTVRAGPGRIAGSLFVRFKINALEPRTQGSAIALLDRAIRSMLRSYDLEMPDSFAVALETLEEGSHSVGPIRMEIASEREDMRRHNIFLSIQGVERRRTDSTLPDFMPGSPANRIKQVSGGL